MRRKSGVWVIVLIAAMTLGLLLTGCGIVTPTVNLNDYVTVNCAGYDGYASVSASVDFNQIIEDYADNLEKNLDTKYFGDKTPALAAMFAFEFYDPYVLAYEAIGDGQNGDVVEFTWNTSEEGIEKLSQVLKVNFKYENFTYEISGLEQIVEVNPFDYLEISYESYDPYAKPILTNTAKDAFLQENMTFRTESKEVAEGDVIAVTVKFNEYQMISNGYHITESSRDITASGVPQPQEIDVFDLLTLTYTGVDGKGAMEYVKEETDDPFLSKVYFKFDKQNHLTTGDTIMCTASYSGQAERKGYKVVSTEKTFTVPQLGKYIDDFTALNEDIQKQLTDAMMEEAERYYASDVRKGYLYATTSILGTAYDMGKFESYSNINLTHVYTSTFTSLLSGDTGYRIGFVLSVDMNGHTTEEANGTRYATGYINNLILNADGTLEVGWEERIAISLGSYMTFELVNDRALKDEANLVLTEWEQK